MTKEKETSINLRNLIFQTILSIVIVLVIVFGLAFFFAQNFLGLVNTLSEFLDIGDFFSE